MLFSRRPNGLDVPFSSEITPEAVYHSRRKFTSQILAGSALAAGGGSLLLPEQVMAADGTGLALAAQRNAGLSVSDKITPFKDASTYNNFYEFGTDKADPARNAGTLKPRPWSVRIEGEIAKPFTLDLESLMKLAPLEERVYRLRCVEGWSMVIPWVGFSLSELIKKAQPTGNAKYIEFVTLNDKKQMPGLNSSVLDWPYVEGLRMDEASHPLTLLTFGMYGSVLPNQNGAPVRIIVPWKYGFKSAKSIVTIRFTATEPKTAWNRTAANEYGFYSNVNPNVNHPRWSQATERRIGEDGFFTPKRPTLMFNGYSQVASLYSGMDLKKYF